MSMLLILEQLMYKLKVTDNLLEIPYPCNYFDLIGGTSTGGCALLLKYAYKIYTHNFHIQSD
jgi:patatin-like phospholipase/acyl hydrolase